MFAFGKQACSRLRVAGGRFAGPEFGNKAAQAQRGVVGAAAGSAPSLWGWGFCLSWGRWGLLLVVLSGLVESFHGARSATPAQTSLRRLRGPARRLKSTRRAGGLLCKQVSEANTAWGNVVTGCRRCAPSAGRTCLCRARQTGQEGVGVAHSAATARLPGWRRHVMPPGGKRGCTEQHVL